MILLRMRDRIGVHLEHSYSNALWPAGSAPKVYLGSFGRSVARTDGAKSLFSFRRGTT